MTRINSWRDVPTKAYNPATKKWEAYAVPKVCRMFLLCEEVATRKVKHPILGDVPSCERCAKKLAPR